VISVGSCDIEDWSNDENSALITEINYTSLYIHLKTVILNCNNISHYYCFTVFLASKLQETLQILMFPNILILFYCKNTVQITSHKT